MVTRYRLLQIAVMGILLAANATAREISVPLLSPPVIDGSLSPGEWDSAVMETLGGLPAEMDFAPEQWAIVGY